MSRELYMLEKIIFNKIFNYIADMHTNLMLPTGTQIKG